MRTSFEAMLVNYEIAFVWRMRICVVPLIIRRKVNESLIMALSKVYSSSSMLLLLVVAAIKYKSSSTFRKVNRL